MSIPLKRQYKIIEKDIAHEIIEGEAIIIHFSTGSYYSLNGVAAKVWSWIEAGATYEELTGVFQNLSPDQQLEIRGFLDGLVNEGLLIASDEMISIARKADSFPLPSIIPFEVPRFDKYNDMQNLLLSDPIHEVDDQRGWPDLPPKS